MSLIYQFDDISFDSVRKEVSTYTLDTFRQDFIAACNVALLTIPQAMAYALLAGLPLSCGLFASIFSSIVSAFFGSSRHLVVGPSNAIAILVQAATAEVLFTYYRHLSGVERDFMAVNILTQLVLLTAGLQILAALCKLGRLIQFVSYSVTVGYVAGTAIAIIINQSFILVGVEGLTGVNSFYERGSYLVTHLDQIHLPSALIGVGSLLMIVVFKRWFKKIPAGATTLAFAALVTFLLDLSSYGNLSGLIDPYFNEQVHKVMLVEDTGNLSNLSLMIGFPYFDTGVMNNLLPVAFALALLSIMETTSVAKTIAANSGQRLSVNQEILGVGLGNLVSSFVGAMPISGSSARSASNYHSGAQTRLASILSATIVGIVLWSFGFLINKIPLASLAALLLVTAFSIVNSKQFFICLKATSSDAFVLWMTLLACIFFSLDIAFYIGVVISIILYLKKAAVPHLVEYDIDESGELIKLTSARLVEHKAIRFIKVEGELFFGAADLFQTTLRAFAEDDRHTKVIILQLKNTRDIDATACLALQYLHDYLKKSECYLILCGLTPPIWEVLSNSGLVELLQKENLFLFDERHPFLYMQRALNRAKGLVAEGEQKREIVQPLPSQIQSVT